MNRKVLLVDDEERILAALVRSLRSDFEIRTASGGEEALQAIQEDGPFAVVMADMNMPGMNGLRLLERVQVVAPDTVRIMLTGNADQQTAADAVNRGHVFCFLSKPAQMNDVVKALEEAITHHMALCAERELLERTLGGCIELLAELIALRDPEGFGESQALQDYVLTLARMQGMADLWPLKVAMRLAQVGRLAVPTDLLNKADARADLSPEEQAVMDRIPETGARLLGGIPRMEEVARIVRYQSKGFDGSGLPADGVKGMALPWGARLIHLVRSFLEAAKGATPREGLEALRIREGSFDPEAFFNLEELVVVPEIPAPEAYRNAASGDKATEAIEIDLEVAQLKPGLLLVKDVNFPRGAVLRAGTCLKATHLEQLKILVHLNRIPGTVRIAAIGGGQEKRENSVSYPIAR